jgi:hypothetical protein
MPRVQLLQELSTVSHTSTAQEPTLVDQAAPAEFEGATWTAASHVSIDHLIPLKEAWVSGARNWTTERRQALANDLNRPQLIAVTVSS